LLTLSGDWEPYAVALLAWLKCSFVVWYCAVFLDDEDLFFQLHLNSEAVPFPALPDKEFLDALAAEGNNVIVEERKFLSECDKRRRRNETDDYDRLRQKHNDSMSYPCVRIDEIVYKFLGLSPQHAKFIDETLSAIRLQTSARSES
jgi:hypothetical protein